MNNCIGAAGRESSKTSPSDTKMDSRRAFDGFIAQIPNNCDVISSTDCQRQQ